MVSVIEPQAAAKHNDQMFKMISDMLLRYDALRPAELKLLAFVRGYMETHNNCPAPALDIIRHMYGPHAGLENLGLLYVHVNHTNAVLKPLGECVYARRGEGYVWSVFRPRERAGEVTQ